MKAKEAKATIHDVAREVGCSIMTVSRALRATRDEATGKKGARYQRVREVAEKLGYKVNPHARALISRKTYNIGFYINHPSFHYFHPYNYANLNSLQQRLEERGYQLGFYYFHSGFDPRFARFLRAPHTYDAIAFYGRNASAEELKIIRKSKIRALSFLEELEGVASITYNEWRGGRMAADALYAAGHRRVGIIWRSKGAARWDKRVEGFLSRAQELGLEVPEAANIQLPHSTSSENIVDPVSSLKQLEPLARDGFDVLLGRETGISALFITSDFLSFPVIHRMDELGIIPGKDLSVVSYDNFEAYGDSPWGTPRVATIDIPRVQMGITAAEFLSGNLNVGPTPHLKLEPSFVSRASLLALSEMRLRGVK